MSKLNCKKPKPCEPIPQPDPIPCSPAFDLCVGDRTLKWDGFCPTVERSRHTPDGTYTSVTVVDGCIVGYGYADEATYTPPYCNPNPAHCQGQGMITTYTVSPNSDNSLVESSSGLFARTFVQGKGNIAVSGKGTVQNPYVISFSGNSEKTIIVGEAGITQRESGDVTYVGLLPTGVQKGMYNGFSINEYGQIIGFSDAVSRDSSSVKAGAGLTATDDGSITTIAHEEHDIPVATVFGGFAVGLNKSGHIVEMERIATVTAGTYTVGAYKMSINEFGSITNVVQDEEVPDGAGTFTTSDNKLVSYDTTGRITDVASLGNTPNATAPQPIRDMYRFSVLGTQVRKEAYGNDVSVLNITDKSFDVQLPSYVVSVLQVQVNGAISHSLNGNILTITHTGAVINPAEKYLTLTLRA